MDHTLETDSTEELKKRIANYERLMNISEVCIVKIRLADYSLVEYNDAMCRMIGYSREEYEQRFHHHMTEYFSDEYRAELDKLQKAATDAIAHKCATFMLNMRIPTRKGALLIGGIGSFDGVDHDGMPTHVIAIYQNMTDIFAAQKKIELAALEKQKADILAVQNHKLYQLIDSVPSGLGELCIVHGVQVKNMKLNRYFTDRVDIVQSEDHVVDLITFLNCLHPHDRERCRQDFFSFLKHKGQLVAQYRFRDTEGTYFWGSVRGTITHVSDEMDIAYFIFSDIDEMKRAERDLQESRKLYENTVNSLRVGLWTYDIRKRRIIMAKNASTEVLRKKFGWPQVFENAPESTLEFVEEQDHAKYLATFREIEAGHDATCDIWYRSRVGIEPYCARETYHTICDDAGQPLLAYGIGQNVTAEKKVEERYEREIGYLRQTDENNLVAKGHYNLTLNSVLEYSTKDDSIFKIEVGISYDEAIRNFLKMPYHEEDRHTIEDKLHRENLIRRYQRGEMQTSLTYRRIREGDLPMWISMNIHTYMMPETGHLECFTYAYDVSDKMISDSIMTLLSAEAFDYIGLIFTKSNQFEFIRKSPRIQFPEVHQKTPYDACCEYVCSNFVSAGELELHKSVTSIENIVAGIRQGNGRHVVTYLRQEGNKTLCKQLNHVWLDQAAGIILVVRSDITAGYERDQRQLAQIEAAKLEAERANEAKSAFLSSMSHDLRTPLNGVIGFTGLALKEPDIAQKQDYLQKIDSSGQLLLDLINDTLELSRIESGKISPEPEVVMPGTLIPTVVTALRPSAELKHIRLVTDMPDDLIGPIWCDRMKFQKIVLNLVSNAIKYTHEGGTVKVSLKQWPTTVPQCPYSLVVEDTGIGMSEEFLQRLYEPFAQEKRSEVCTINGTGLGLAIVKRYVDLLGGTISVESRIHQGTRFVVSLPVQKAEEGQTSPQEVLETRENLKGIRVLLCEDNQLNAEIAMMLLKNKGMLVETAGNGKEGLDKFTVSQPGYYDVILMDIRMPVMDGFEATKHIRALGRSDAQRVPIIAMTADAFDESIRQAKSAGMDDYVTKPVEPGKLYQILSRNLYQ